MNHEHPGVPLAHGLVIGGSTSLLAFAQDPNSSLIPVVCAAIGMLVPASQQLFKWYTATRDKKIDWLTDELKRQYAENQALRERLDKKEASTS